MAELSDIANQTIQDEIEEYLERPEEIARFVELFSRAKPAMQDIAAAIIEGDDDEVDELTAKALVDGIDAIEIMDDGLIGGMGIVGIKFRENFVFVPEVLSCARAMRAGMAHIEPILSASGIESQGTVIMGTVKGDLHDIGKNLCIMMLRGSGFEVIDLGVNVPTQRFLEATTQHQAAVVCLSALLSSTMNNMKDVVATFRNHSDLKDTKILIGGAPVSHEFSQNIGADGYAPTAPAAVERVQQLCGQ